MLNKRAQHKQKMEINRIIPSFLLELICSLSFIVAITFVTAGCDGYHRTIFTIAPDTKTSETMLTASKNQVTRQELEAFLLDFSSKNKMWCHPYNSKMHSMFCGISPGINIELHENPDTGQLTLRISQFGPWHETVEYLTLRDYLLKEIPEKFPTVLISHDNDK